MSEDPYREVGMHNDFLLRNSHGLTGVELELKRVQSERDCLLAACKALVESGRTPRDTEEFRAAVAAIAKAEGR